MNSTSVRWCTKLRRKQGISEKSTTGRETYLEELYPGVMSSYFIVSKEFKNPSNGKPYYHYAPFSNYPDLYRYIKSQSPKERRFHEIVGGSRGQKPRFDIDVDSDKYEKAKTLNVRYRTMSIVEMGELVKDMVIESVIGVASFKKLDLDLGKDFMVFTSHGKEKQSYHIILNRYFQLGSSQALALYKEAMAVSQDPALFSLLVDGSIYGAGRSIRMMWSTKLEDIQRVKTYNPVFTYKGVSYNHTIEARFDASVNITVGMQMGIMLANSLITYIDEANLFPAFVIKERTAEREEMSDDTYAEAKAIIKEWDVDKAYCVTGSEEGKVVLERLHPSYCCLCDRTHEEMGTFCYVSQAHLYWHCGHAKGVRGVRIGRLKTVLNEMEEFASTVLAGSKVTVYDDEGEQLTSTTYRHKVVEAPMVVINGVASEMMTNATTSDRATRFRQRHLGAEASPTPTPIILPTLPTPITLPTPTLTPITLPSPTPSPTPITPPTPIIFDTVVLPVSVQSPPPTPKKDVVPEPAPQPVTRRVITYKPVDKPKTRKKVKNWEPTRTFSEPLPVLQPGQRPRTLREKLALNGY